LTNRVLVLVATVVGRTWRLLSPSTADPVLWHFTVGVGLVGYAVLVAFGAIVLRANALAVLAGHHVGACAFSALSAAAVDPALLSLAGGHADALAVDALVVISALEWSPPMAATVEIFAFVVSLIGNVGKALRATPDFTFVRDANALAMSFSCFVHVALPAFGAPRGTLPPTAVAAALELTDHFVGANLVTNTTFIVASVWTFFYLPDAAFCFVGLTRVVEWRLAFVLSHRAFIRGAHAQSRFGANLRAGTTGRAFPSTPVRSAGLTLTLRVTASFTNVSVGIALSSVRALLYFTP